MTAAGSPLRPVGWAGAGAGARLSDYAVGRDNNFNLIRLLAALGVIFSHSVAALGLPMEREFFGPRVGFSLGGMAVDVFFVTSGFLVTASLVGRRDIVAFLWARALRIYPALWVMLLLTIFVLGPAVTAWPAGDYFSAAQTWSYLGKCATLIGGVRYALPGVFDQLPLKGEVNGSLWTLPIEARLYLWLAAAWLVLAVVSPVRMKALRLLAPIAVAVFAFLIVKGQLETGNANGREIRQFMFIYGAALYLWRDRVPMSPVALVALPAILVLASINQTVFFLAYAAFLAPLVMHLAYLPGGRVRRFNGWGDFSYGVYIYAFPIQQTIVLLMPGLSLAAMVALSCVVTLAVAVLSWNLVEKPALARKESFAAASSLAFRQGLRKVGAWVKTRRLDGTGRGVGAGFAEKRDGFPDRLP